MSTPPHDGPERRREAGKFITMDAAMLAAQNERIDRLVQSVEGLSEALSARPTRYEVARKRRITAFLVSLLAVGVIFAHDEHLEKCGPGTETKAIVEYVLEHPAELQIDRKKLQEIGSAATPNACGVTFPLHTHDDELEWPTVYSWMGLFGYAVAFGAGGYFAFRRPPVGVVEKKPE